MGATGDGKYWKYGDDASLRCPSTFTSFVTRKVIGKCMFLKGFKHDRHQHGSRYWTDESQGASRG
jgi:hypothetical protein